MKEIKGKVWKFGDNIDTDLITTTKLLELPIEELATHVLEAIMPEFAGQVRPGDVIVAGRNFGCGSSREEAPAALKQLGVGCIVAESYARTFFRNCIAIGLPAVICKDIGNIFKQGDTALVDFGEEMRITNVAGGRALRGEPMDSSILSIVESGGMMEKLKLLSKSINEKCH
jgi:3-isopropylmalate dehydratase small subunit